MGYGLTVNYFHRRSRHAARQRTGQRASPVRRTAGARRRRRRAAHGIAIGPHGRVTMASTHAAKNGWKPRRRRHASRVPARVWGKWGWGANELARSGDAGVGALCRCAHASGLRSRHPSTCTVTPALALQTSHPSFHPSSSTIIIGYVTSNISRNVTSNSLRIARALRLGGEGLVAPHLHLSVTRHRIRSYLQLPALHPIFISFISLCSGPVYRRLGVTASPHFRQARWPIQFRQLTKP